MKTGLTPFRVLPLLVFLITLFPAIGKAQGTSEAESNRSDAPRQQTQEAPPLIPRLSVEATPNLPTLIQGSYGTKALIPANAFVFQDGTPVTGPVTVTVLEVANKSGMILQGLPTVSGGRLLESGGVVKITAESSGQQVELAPDKAIYVQFPGGNLPGMQLFSGVESGNGVKDWIPMPTAKPSQEELDAATQAPAQKSPLDLLTQYGKAHPKTLLFEDENQTVNGSLYGLLETCYSCCGNDAVYLEVLVDTTGKHISAKTLTGRNQCYKKALLELIAFVQWDYSQLTPLYPKSKEPRRIYFEVKPVIPCSGWQGENTFVSLAERANFGLSESDMNKFKKIAEEARMANFANSAMSVTQLGWINCDRFSEEQNVIAFNVEAKSEGTPSNTHCYLAMNSINSVLEGVRLDNGNWQFSRVPAGMDAKVVAISWDAEKGPSIGMMHVRTKGGNLGSLEMKSVTEAKVHSLLRAI